MKDRFFLYSNYFDVTINALAFGFLITLFLFCHSEEPRDFTPFILGILGWILLLYFSLVIGNGGRIIVSVFATPLKAFTSMLFLFSSLGMIGALFNRQNQVEDRIKNGIFSGLMLYLLNKLVRSTQR